MQRSLLFLSLLFLPLQALGSEDPATGASESTAPTEVVTAKTTQSEIPDPFGLDLGGDFAPFADGCSLAKEDVYQCSTVPVPLGGVKTYLVLVNNGKIARVHASGEIHENDDYGSKVRAEYDKLKDLLAKKYGNPQEYDFLRAGSIWKESKYFAMSLYTDQRVLESYWLLEGYSIALKVQSLGSAETYVVLSYEHTPTVQAIQQAREEKNIEAL